MKTILLFLLVLCRTKDVVQAFAPLSAAIIPTTLTSERGMLTATTYDRTRITSLYGTESSNEDNDFQLSLPEQLSMPDVSALSDKISELDIGQVLTNLQSGEVGTRGELYVIGQFALIFFILIGGVPVIGETLELVTGPLFLLGGLATIGISLIDLGTDSLTPFLPPTEEGSFKSEGIYSQVRHPLYAGLVATMAGLSIVTNSANRLLLTVALYVLVRAKAEIEEDYLCQKYPDQYKEYMVREESFVVSCFLLG